MGAERRLALATSRIRSALEEFDCSSEALAAASNQSLARYTDAPSPAGWERCAGLVASEGWSITQEFRLATNSGCRWIVRLPSGTARLHRH
jgi:hypothetical protein